MNSLINKKIADNQFFNIEGNKLTIASSKEIGITSITDYVAKNIFTELKQTKLEDGQYKILQHNLKFIKTKIDKHNNVWYVKLANRLGLDALISEFGLDKYNFFANLKICDTHIIDSFIDEQVIENLQAEGFGGETITKILDFIRKPDDSFSLKNLYLNKIPTIIFTHPAFSHLKTLDLSGNKLTTLPAEISKLTNLQELNLCLNRLTTLPAEIGNLTNLQRLDFGGNKLTTLPAEIGSLTNLQRLELGGNELTALPEEISRLTDLQELMLGANRFITLPAQICKLTNLRGLYLHANELTTLPAEIDKLTNLNNLHLRANRFTTLPIQISNLTNLQELNLNGNQLTNLPAEIGKLTNLQELNLDGNQLTNLPAEISKLTMLSKLYLKNNGSLTGLTEILRLPKKCTVEFSDLSEKVLENLREAISQPNYAGPTFSFLVFIKKDDEQVTDDGQMYDVIAQKYL